MNFSKDKKQFLIVYQITNLLNNKIYIGAHCTNNINDNYMGSSKSLKKDIKELGKQNFEKIPLHVFDNQEDMRKKEAELVTKEFCLREDTYNIMKGGIQTFTWIGTVVVKDKDGNKTMAEITDAIKLHRVKQASEAYKELKAICAQTDLDSLLPVIPGDELAGDEPEEVVSTVPTY